MLPKIIISKRLLDRLRSVKHSSYGVLFAVKHENVLLIIGVHLHHHCTEVETVKVKNAFPAEVYAYGVVYISDIEVVNEEIKSCIKEYVRITDNPVLLKCKIGEKHFKAFYAISNNFESVQYQTVTDDEILHDFVYARLQTKLPIKCELNLDSIRNAFANLRALVASGNFAFTFPGTNIYIMGNDKNEESGLVGLTGKPIVSELCAYTAGIVEVINISKNKRTTKEEIEILNVSMLQCATTDDVDNPNAHAPIIEVHKNVYECLNISFQLDTLSMIHRNTKVQGLHEIFVESLMRNIRLIEIAIVNEIQSSVGNKPQISTPETFHFFPEGCGHFFTIIYCKNWDENKLAKERENLHSQLLLPIHHPFFRRSNQYCFKSNNSTNSLLINPHLGLQNTGNGGEIFTVRGNYAYHHYMQDNMNDSGWGCAYRSLQTLVSWFKMQGYINKPVPTHKDIQKCLVDIGDKPSTFINSKNWIGSMEVSFVLESMFGINSRILSVSKGDEMETVGPDLAAHFQNHGSPIMIGGGVLAHTILGVDYNKETGSVKFLILDPHYTGAEDLKTVQSKGWCGWKPITFWDKTAYYNMCLPQVPRCV